MNNEPALKDDPAAIVREVHNWNAHKQAFIPHHIQTAYSRLRAAGWLAPRSSKVLAQCHDDRNTQ